MTVIKGLFLCLKLWSFIFTCIVWKQTAPRSLYHPNNNVVFTSPSWVNGFYAMFLRRKLSTCWLDACVLQYLGWSWKTARLLWLLLNRSPNWLMSLFSPRSVNLWSNLVSCAGLFIIIHDITKAISEQFTSVGIMLMSFERHRWDVLAYMTTHYILCPPSGVWSNFLTYSRPK